MVNASATPYLSWHTEDVSFGWSSMSLWERSSERSLSSVLSGIKS